MDLPVNASANVSITGRIKSGAREGGELNAKLTPAPGYQNESSENQVAIPTALFSGQVFEERRGTDGSHSSRRKGIPEATVVLASLEQGFNPKRRSVDNWTPAILTHTDANGYYVFPVPKAAHKYRIVTLSRSLTDNRGVWAEQVWGGPYRRCTGSLEKNSQNRVFSDAGYCFGGRRPGWNDIKHDLDALWKEDRGGCRADFCPMLPAIPLGSHEIWQGEHTIEIPENLVSARSRGVTGLDFGFSYDVVTHVNDSGQGSLRQFIDNANQNAGTKRMRFVPAVDRNHDWGWQINLMHSLAVLSQDRIVLDGTALQFDQPGVRALSSQSVRSGVRVGRETGDP